MNRVKIIFGAAIAIAILLIIPACTQPDEENSDRKVSQDIEKRFLQSQPIPKFERSQLRQTLIEIQEAQADAIATTSFFFNQGVVDPIYSCPSLGMPIPTTSQLSNPEIVVKKRGEGGYTQVLPNMEPTGIYTGDSTGTYVLCVDAQGRPFTMYWEGFVSNVAGAAEWNKESHQVELVGPPSGEFTGGK
jgi:hypothetical protein